METQPNSLKAIRILYLFLLASQIVFALMVTLLLETGVLSTINSSVTPLMQVMVIVITAGAVPASFFLFRTRLSDINPEEDLGKKLEKYRAALILRMALCQMPTIFATIAYFITNNHSFLWMIILLISNFLFIYPSNGKIVSQLQLNSMEQTTLGLNP